jgi:hypothetical protein
LASPNSPVVGSPVRQKRDRAGSTGLVRERLRAHDRRIGAQAFHGFPGGDAIVGDPKGQGDMVGHLHRNHSSREEELEEVALESTRTIEIDEFVEKSEIDSRYLIRPYYLRPDGKVGHDAFAVIRETIPVDLAEWKKHTDLAVELISRYAYPPRAIPEPKRGRGRISLRQNFRYVTYADDVGLSFGVACDPQLIFTQPRPPLRSGAERPCGVGCG